MSDAGSLASQRNALLISRLLLPLFFVSGLSSLVYQVAWQRLLTLHYGVGSISITLIVSVYMLGLGLGALVGGQLSERLRSGLGAYAVIELLICLFGVASLPFLGFLGRLTAGSSYVVSLASMFLFLLLPTLLMGATLPLLVKIFSGLVRDFARSVSLLYFVNTLGAAVGAFATAYLFISFWGLDRSIYFAAGMNLFLAAAVLLLANRESGARAAMRREAAAPVRAWNEPALGARAYPLVFVAGFLAIGYELVWFRLIGVLIKGSPYAFATILSVYLFGIAVGSYAVVRFLRWRPEVRRVGLFFLLQFLIGVSVVVLVGGFHHLARVGSFRAFLVRYFQQELHPLSWRLDELSGVLLWPGVLELVPTLLMGATFPLLACLALSRPDREGATMGRVYFVNTMGNLVGGLVTGFVLLASLGTERTLLVFASTNIALLLFAPHSGGKAWRARSRLAVVGSAILAAVLVLPGPGELYRFMHRHAAVAHHEGFFEEGVDAVVATFQSGPRIVNFINGMGHGGRPGYGFAMQAAEALAASPRPEEVLIIGFGTGTIAEFALLSDEVERVTVVELSRTLMRNLRKIRLFQPILADERLEVVYDDGRRFLLGTDQRYDLILMDPLRTTTAYSNNLYSLEFFQLVSRRLRPCGVLLLWTDDPVVVPRTAATVFSHLAFHRLRYGHGFMLASGCPLERNARRWDAIRSRAPREMRGFLTEAQDRLGSGLDRSALLHATDGAPINRDWRPVSEYYLGTGRRTRSR